VVGVKVKPLTCLVAAMAVSMGRQVLMVAGRSHPDKIKFASTRQTIQTRVGDQPSHYREQPPISSDVVFGSQ